MSLRACVLLLAAALPSCSSVTFPTSDELAEFEKAGPILPEYNPKALPPFDVNLKPYKLAHGDVLEIDGPTALFELSPGNEPSSVKSYKARVDDEGRIRIPLVGGIEVAGQTLAAVEAKVVKLVHPKFFKRQPFVHLRIFEYRSLPITVHGAVRNPGMYELRSDRLSLLGAIGAAGGVAYSVDQPGARMVRIRKPNSEGTAAALLPVRNLSIPMQDVALKGGETIEVVPFSRQIFTAVGLVNKPGAHDYPTNADYTLLQAIAIAGGPDRLADPPYATVYRRTADGRTISATFPIWAPEDKTPSASEIRVKKGDVISIQHTPGSWTRALAAEVLRFQVGFFVDPRSL